jgi:type IV secretory pathway TraG/TraD family ATPase VirD4
MAVVEKIYFDRETPHYVYLGYIGSGKSVIAVIPTCSFIAHVKKKRSVFITDPKGEIFTTTSEMFSNNGYKIYGRWFN